MAPEIAGPADETTIILCNMFDDCEIIFEQGGPGAAQLSAHGLARGLNSSPSYV
jgi:hypothetical protein